MVSKRKFMDNISNGNESRSARGFKDQSVGPNVQTLKDVITYDLRQSQYQISADNNMTSSPCLFEDAVAQWLLNNGNADITTMRLGRRYSLLYDVTLNGNFLDALFNSTCTAVTTSSRCVSALKSYFGTTAWNAKVKQALFEDLYTSVDFLENTSVYNTIVGVGAYSAYIQPFLTGLSAIILNIASNVFYARTIPCNLGSIGPVFYLNSVNTANLTSFATTYGYVVPTNNIMTNDATQTLSLIKANFPEFSYGPREFVDQSAINYKLGLLNANTAGGDMKPLRAQAIPTKIDIAFNLLFRCSWAVGSTPYPDLYTNNGIPTFTDPFQFQQSLCKAMYNLNGAAMITGLNEFLIPGRSGKGNNMGISLKAGKTPSAPKIVGYDKAKPSNIATNIELKVTANDISNLLNIGPDIANDIAILTVMDPRDLIGKDPSKLFKSNAIINVFNQAIEKVSQPINKAKEMYSGTSGLTRTIVDLGIGAVGQMMRTGVYDIRLIGKALAIGGANEVRKQIGKLERMMPKDGTITNAAERRPSDKSFDELLKKGGPQISDEEESKMYNRFKQFSKRYNKGGSF